MAKKVKRHLLRKRLLKVVLAVLFLSAFSSHTYAYPLPTPRLFVFREKLLFCSQEKSNRRVRTVPSYAIIRDNQIVLRRLSRLSSTDQARLVRICRRSIKQQVPEFVSNAPCGNGDLDNNGRVDFKDLNLLFKLLIQRVRSADIDEDGATGIGDISLLYRCLSNSEQNTDPEAPPTPEPTPIPSPTSTATPAPILTATPSMTPAPPTVTPPIDISDAAPRCLSDGSCIFVDTTLTQGCIGATYSVINRNCSGSDGVAYAHLQDIAGSLYAGTTVLIRGGIYNTPSVQGGRHLKVWDKHGTAESPIVIRNFPGEVPYLVGNGSNWSIVLVELSSYVLLRGLDISNGQRGLEISNSSFITVQLSRVHHNSDKGFLIGRTTRGGSGELLGAHHVLVQYSEIYANGFSGLVIGDRLGTFPAHDNIVEDSLAYENGWADADTGGSGFIVLGGNPEPPIQTYSNVFRRLVSFANTSTQIGLQDTYNSAIEDSLLFYSDIYNVIDPGGRRGDGRGMKFGTSMDSTFNGTHRFAGNTVFSNPHVGVLVDGVVRNSKFYNNTIYYGGWAQWGEPGDYGYGAEINNSTTDVRNNIFYNNRVDIKANSTGVYDYNLFGAVNSSFLSFIGPNSIYRQKDSDGDGIGDACDPDSISDSDRDGVIDPLDLCPSTFGDGGVDSDNDGVGDDCDRNPQSSLNNPDRGPATCLNDQDGDLWCDDQDNCPSRFNPVDPMFSDSSLDRKFVNVQFSSISGIVERIEFIRTQVRALFSLQTHSPAVNSGQVIEGYHCDRADDDSQNPYSQDDQSCRHWNGVSPDLGAYETQASPR